MVHHISMEYFTYSVPASLPECQLFLHYPHKISCFVMRINQMISYTTIHLRGKTNSPIICLQGNQRLRQCTRIYQQYVIWRVKFIAVKVKKITLKLVVCKEKCSAAVTTSRHKFRTIKGICYHWKMPKMQSISISY